MEKLGPTRQSSLYHDNARIASVPLDLTGQHP
jgi:hypothetical protein